MTQGRRREFASFGWGADEVPDPQARSTVEASTLDWNEPRRPAHARMLAWYRDLIALRRRLDLGRRGLWPGLRDVGDVIVLTVPARPGRREAELVVATSLAPADRPEATATGLDGLVPDAAALDVALSWRGASPNGSILHPGETMALLRYA